MVGGMRLCAAVLAFALAATGGRALAASYAYILNDSTNTVSVIDTATNTVIATPDVGGTSLHGSAVLPNGNFAYLGVSGTNQVAVVDTVTQAVVATIGGFNQPRGLAALPDSSRVYVANQSAARIDVIDTATNTVTAQIALTPGTTAVALAASPDGSRVYVVQDTANQLRYIDTATDTLNAASVAAGASPSGLAVSPDGATIYVAASGNALVRVFDAATMTQTRTITAANNPLTVAVSPDGATLYVPAIGGNVLHVIEAATGNSIANVPTAAQPAGVSLNPAGTRAYVTSISGNTVTVVDTASNTIVTTLGMPRPSGMGKFVTPELSRLTVNPNGGTVTAKTAAGPVLACDGNSASCRRNYAASAAVSLTAGPPGGSVFYSWSGDCSGTTASITVTMTAARNCTPLFFRPAGPAGAAAGLAEPVRPADRRCRARQSAGQIRHLAGTVLHHDADQPGRYPARFPEPAVHLRHRRADQDPLRRLQAVADLFGAARRPDDAEPGLSARQHGHCAGHRDRHRYPGHQRQPGTDHDLPGAARTGRDGRAVDDGRRPGGGRRCRYPAGPVA